MGPVHQQRTGRGAGLVRRGDIQSNGHADESGNTGEPEHNYNLVPQVVATQVAKRVTQSSKFYVRQVSLRYRNPGNRPDAYETLQLQRFQHNPPREIGRAHV